MTPSPHSVTKLAALHFPPLPVQGVATFILWPEDLEEATFATALGLLSRDEIARLERLAFARDKRLVGAARILLRLALAHYLECWPQDIVLSLGVHGKPYVRSLRRLDFSVSHCDGCVVVAIAREAMVGVDVESLVKAQPEYEATAQRYFSTAEYDWVRLAEPTQGPTRFLELWTLKEAYLKAIGRGLSKGLKECEFGFFGNDGLRFIDSDPADAASGAWHFELHELSESFRLSLATDAAPGLARSSMFVVDLNQGLRQVELTPLRSGRSDAPWNCL